eukprot:gnl/TRDRNA2_/TRDRNA2_139609_c0_seq3.p2 gnl/TRDRNA2_/TRDRNA2_139609_c0~~gnl/TRDRNA2_/TRDRNA2_139609_c0_seq3.p2  ORF type:complete len:113 (+),score=0.14 gnl/TRDRNA2_/TRDRNA2_139609_c0_seq3:1096-1434(+)
MHTSRRGMLFELLAANKAKNNRSRQRSQVDCWASGRDPPTEEALFVVGWNACSFPTIGFWHSRRGRLLGATKTVQDLIRRAAGLNICLIARRTGECPLAGVERDVNTQFRRI